MNHILNLIKPLWLYILLIAAVIVLTAKIKLLVSDLQGCKARSAMIAVQLDSQNNAIKKLSDEEKKAKKQYDRAMKESRKEEAKYQKELIELSQEKVSPKCEEAISWGVDIKNQFK